MDLHSTPTVWLTRDRARRWSPLARDVEADVVVVGAGVSGALLAHRIAEHGLRPVVLDARQPGQGSTAASTAILIWEPDRPLAQLARRLGRERAERAYRACRRAVTELAALAERLGGCGLRRAPSLYVASTDDDVPALREEFEGRRRAGLDVAWLGDGELRDRYGAARAAAIRSAPAAQLDPFAFTLALLGEVERMGGAVHGVTEVVSWRRDGAGVRVVTRLGRHVRARRVVFAAGYETPRFLDRRLLELYASYAIAARPELPPAWRDEAPVLWETSRPYTYLRTLADGGLLVGGADEPFTSAEERDRLVPRKALELVAAARSLQPALPAFEPAIAWAGTFGQTADTLPYAGALPEYPGALFSLAYGANGIVFAAIAAEIVTNALLGRSDAALTEVFGFGR